MKIKNCPLCGGVISALTLLGTTTFQCESDKCGAQIQFTTIGLHVREQRERFNTRALPTEAIKVAIEKLEHGAEALMFLARACESKSMAEDTAMEALKQADAAHALRAMMETDHEKM